MRFTLRLIISFICSIIIIILSIYAITVHHKTENNTVTKRTHIEKVIYIDRKFNPQQKNLIHIAATEWQNKTKGIVKFTIATLPVSTLNVDNSVVINCVSPDDPEIIFVDAIAGGTSQHLGLTNMSAIIPNVKIVDSRITSSHTFKSVILHELGHVIGLKHNEGTHGLNSVMFSSADFGSDSITSVDLENFCTVYQCNYKELLQK
jgi:hypothetical protein